MRTRKLRESRKERDVQLASRVERVEEEETTNLRAAGSGIVENAEVPRFEAESERGEIGSVRIEKSKRKETRRKVPTHKRWLRATSSPIRPPLQE